MKLIPILFLMVISSISYVGNKTCEERIKNKDIFTAEQIQLKSQQCENLKPKRNAFKATLSEEQKAIKKDKSITKKERREKLKSTFLAEQQKMKEEIKAIRKEQRKEFKKTLTPEQKATLKKRRKNKS